MDRRPVSLTAYWRLVRDNRNFRLLWGAQAISELGDWLYSISIYSLLLELTGSAQAIALAVVLQELPQLFAAPAAGVLNDRLSRKRIMIFADLVRAAIVLLMILVQTRELIGVVYALLLAETMMWAFFEPARSSMIPTVTPPEDLLVANSISSTTWSVNLAVGSAVGGLVAVAFGRNTVFLLNALSFLVSAALLRRMRVTEPHMAGAPPMKVRELTDFSPVLDGLRYVTRDRRRLATLLTKAGLGLAATSWVLLPVLGERYFPVSAPGLDPTRAGMLGMSLLMGARGVGALLGPLIGGYWAQRMESRLRLGILAGFLANAAGYLVLGTASSLGLAIAGVVISHAGGSLVWVFSTTLLQTQTADRFRGRVFSADYACLVVAMSSVTYLAGSLIDHGMSARTVAALTGLVGLGPALAWAFALRLWKQPAAPSLPDDRHR
ncbi:MAG TPA: MFS transporter [Bryobacteraceae bacterium]|nr:MFS transporter [Bryobacteraceae bacterium]